MNLLPQRQRPIAHFSCTTHTTLPVTDRAAQDYCFNCIIEQHQTMAYNLAHRMLGDWAMAEDATQEAFLSAFRAFKGFRGENLKGWLFRIVANTCRDLLRSAKARPSVSLDPVVLEAQEPLNPVDQSPEEQALRAELRQVLNQSIQSLNLEQRMAVVLVDVQGFGYEEAAQAMGCSLGTVKSRLSRGRAALRDLLMSHRELLPHPFRQQE